MTIATLPITKQIPTTLTVHPSTDFVETPVIKDLTQRALSYLTAGYPVHFRGQAGTGKTTLALHVASHLNRPVMLIVGDEEFTTSSLIGGQQGYRYRKVVDRYIHSVLKLEEDASQQWVDNRLTTACREGFTLVYDEFTRSRPETNNILLAVLEEHFLVLPNANHRDGYIRVHPEFRAIFTSNPQEYAGVHDAQDALSDRLLTMDLEYFNRETEIHITTAKSGMSEEDVYRIVDIVRDFRASGEYDQTPTMRSSIMIAKIASQEGLHPSSDDPRFITLCLDILESKTSFTSQARERRAQQRKMLLKLIEHHSKDENL